MPGRKDRDKARSKEKSGGGGGGGGLAAMLGLGMDPGLDIQDDADLEAELLALSGKSPGKKGKSASKKPMMSMQDMDKMMADLENIGEGDDDEEGDGDLDEDDEELLGELQELEEDSNDKADDVTLPSASSSHKPTPPASQRSGNGSAPSKPKPDPVRGGGAGGVVSQVVERIEIYRQAIQQAEAAGESSKVRRYKRSMTPLEQMLKTAKAGRPVNLEEMPPPVYIKDKPAAASSSSSSSPAAGGSSSKTQVAAAAAPPPSKPKPPPDLINLDDPEFDEFNIGEEEMAALAASMTDDRVQPRASQQPQIPAAVGSSGSGSGKPVPKPRSKPAPKPPPMTASGMIDLDDPEFDEFNLTEEEFAAMAASMVDDRQPKKPKLQESVGASSQLQPPAPLTRPSLRPTTNAPSATGLVEKRFNQEAAPKSLPATLSKPVSESSDKATLRALLMERKDQYQSAARAAKEPTKNKEYRLIAAKFVRVIKAVDSGEQVDLMQMPPPPPGYATKFNVDPSKFSAPAPPPPSSSPSASLTPKSQSQSGQGRSEAGGSTEETSEAAANPEIPVPKNALEALEQRLAKYNEGKKSAEEKGESSRMRRMGRIVKQYESAIRDLKTGKPHDLEELPCPPGYPPIPAAGSGGPARPNVPLPTQSLPASRSPLAQAGGSVGPAPKPSLSQQQLTLVERRMAELKTAARQENSKGDKEKALHYVKMMKGLENMLQAARSGLPVNLQQVPPSPFADVSKTAPSANLMSHLRPAEEKDAATFELIIKQLEKQISVCEKNAETYKKIGSNSSAIEYDNMAQNCQKELLALKGIQTRGYGPPKFSLEVRKLTIVHSNVHLSSGVCEVEITRVVDLPCPPKYEEKDMNVYVEVEFPYPNDDPPKSSTNTVSRTCCPEFKDQPQIFDIDRKHHRSMMRAFKRSPVKCTLWQKRSFKKDMFLGVVNLQLEALETKSEVNAIVDILDERGRKPVGGKMEVATRLREPITGRDVEETEEQWLVFQEAIAEKSATPMPKLVTSPKKQGGAAAGGSPNYSLLSPVKIESTTSLAALRVELSLAASAIKGGHKDPHTVQKAKLIKARLDAIQQKLDSDTKFRQAYPMQVTKEMQSEKHLEAQLVKQNKQVEIMILQKRRAAMEKELAGVKKK